MRTSSIRSFRWKRKALTTACTVEIEICASQNDVCVSTSCSPQLAPRRRRRARALAAPPPRRRRQARRRRPPPPAPVRSMVTCSPSPSAAASPRRRRRRRRTAPPARAVSAPCISMPSSSPSSPPRSAPAAAAATAARAAPCGSADAAVEGHLVVDGAALEQEEREGRAGRKAAPIEAYAPRHSSDAHHASPSGEHATAERMAGRTSMPSSAPIDWTAAPTIARRRRHPDERRLGGEVEHAGADDLHQRPHGEEGGGALHHREQAQPPQKTTPHSPTSTCRETTSAAFSLKGNGAALKRGVDGEIRIREARGRTASRRARRRRSTPAPGSRTARRAPPATATQP